MTTQATMIPQAAGPSPAPTGASALAPIGAVLSAPAETRVGLPRHAEMPAEIDKKFRLAEIFAQSGLCPEAYNEKNPEAIKAGFRANVNAVFVALQLGSELGLSPWMAMQNIAVINGKPSVMFQAKLGVCQATGLLEDHGAEYTPDGCACTYTVKRRGRRVIAKTFSMDDAKRGGLLEKKGPWQTYPKDMLLARAGSRALNEAFPEVLAGLPTPDESSDYDIETSGVVVQRSAAPRDAGWQMTVQRFAELRSVAGARGIPTEVRAAMSRDVTGGRQVEIVEGIPQLTEPEFKALMAAARAWSPPPTAAPSATRQDRAAAPRQPDPETEGDGPPEHDAAE